MDSAAIEQRVQKNISGDGITGVHIDVRNGIVTLSGDVRSPAQRDRALRDAQKVRGVSMVVDRITIKS